MNAHDLPHQPFSAIHIVLVGLVAALAAVAAQGAPLDDMVALDAVYIPALAMTNAAAQDAAFAPKARAALGALQSQWPALKQRLAITWGTTVPAGWPVALASTERHIEAASGAARQDDWKQAHDALEPVRIDLMKIRQRQGLDYFVDRLTAFHEPMEQLAQAGSTWPPSALDTSRRDELVKAYAHARTLWRGIEGQSIDVAQYGLSPARAAQLRKSIDEESAALAQLSDALRGGDKARVLKAAAAIKPPYARAFMAFGQPATQAGQ
jgi:hypothetical protein